MPALSAFIMTSNPPPPVSDGALMKRFAARYFPDKEVHLKDTQQAKDFDALLSQLSKLHELGRFRNKFLMDPNNQQIILDRKLIPFEKAKKIAAAAYEQAQMQIPDWLLTKQLEQKHLEESIVDAKEAVQTAVESMAINQMKNLRGINELDKYKTPFLRFDHLATNKLLPFAKRLKEKGQGDNLTKFYEINSGILAELCNYGITKEQLPNLKALADYMHATYHKSNGKMVLQIHEKELKAYFEPEEEGHEQQQ